MTIRMRLTSIVALAALLTSGTAARAQQGAAPSQTQSPSGGVDFGVRLTDVSGDQARFQRFRDVSDGALVDRIRFDREGSSWYVRSGADHAGRRDQRYWARYGASRVKLFFQWDQIPLFVSQDTRTLFSVESPGMLRIDDDIQQSLQNGQLRLADVVGRATGFDVRSRRDTAQLSFVYSATQALDAKLNFKTARRDGTMPWGASFGFSNAAEVPAPIDTRTTDLDVSLEWVNSRGMLRVGYDASWFTNHVESLVWDNPWRLTDGPSGTVGAQGRLALWPSSNTNGINAAGSVKLPADSRVTATVTVGSWNQNQPLLPYTIKTTLVNAALDRPTAQGEARTLAMSYVFTSRPNRFVWINGRYRYYDFDNRTPPFAARGKVTMDTTQATNGLTAEPLSSTRHNLDIDASLTPLPFTAVRVGYGREEVDRTFRIFERTTDDVVRASIDTTAGRITIRGIVEHANRAGSDFDPELLAAAGDQPALRHFDIADRGRNRATVLLQINPSAIVSLTASAARGRDDYKNSGFGLRDNENRAYTFTADLTPVDDVAAGVSYVNETYIALQNSRTASPGAQFVDPTRNWSIDTKDEAKTAMAYLDLLKLVRNTEVRFAYNISRSKTAYVYGTPAGSTLAALQQLPPVTNELQTGTADVRYFLTRRLALGLVYWYDRYRVEDFALGPNTMNRLDQPGSLFLGYLYRPYTANSASVRFMYLW